MAILLIPIVISCDSSKKEEKQTQKKTSILLILAIEFYNLANRPENRNVMDSLRLWLPKINILEK